MRVNFNIKSKDKFIRVITPKRLRLKIICPGKLKPTHIQIYTFGTQTEDINYFTFSPF